MSIWCHSLLRPAGRSSVARVPTREARRSPYAIAFKRLDATFILVTLHVYWGSKSSQDIGQRARELESVATWLGSWAADVNSWDQNLICLGDFNIDRRGGTLWNAFTSTGLTVPEQIDRPRVIAGKPLDHYYDQIAWFTADLEGTEPLLSPATPSAPACSTGARRRSRTRA